MKIFIALQRDLPVSFFQQKFIFKVYFNYLGKWEENSTYQQAKISLERKNGVSERIFNFNNPNFFLTRVLFTMICTFTFSPRTLK